MEKLTSNCTTLIVGTQQTERKSRIVARSADNNAVKARNLTIYHDTDNGKPQFIAEDSPFRCDLPRKAYGYTTLEGHALHGHWGSAGYNSQKVGMSATETIFSNKKALAADPMPVTGIGENATLNVVLPYITTAREGVERLGQLIEQHGAREGFGVGFIDQHETWYLETASGHRWMAMKMPEDKYFITGNQSRFRHYDPEDKENYLGSSDLIPFAIANKLYDPAEGEFDFHEAYSRDEALDHTYNYPRVWGIQKMLSPSINNDVTKNTFPVFAEPEKKLTMDDIRKVFRYHYQGTSHDPYQCQNPREEYRPVSIFRTTQTHILEVRPHLPAEIGEINYVALGMADLGVFIPFYQGMTRYLKEYTQGNKQCSDDSAYWKFRKVMVLGMMNYNKYAPLIQQAYLKWEQQTDVQMLQFEKEYMQTPDPQKPTFLQNYQDTIMQSAMDLADQLTNKLFTEYTRDIQKKYLFHGA